MCAISSAFEFTHAPWTSRLRRKTGRSGTMSSSSSLVGVPPGKWAMSQPPPKIHGCSGLARAYGRDRVAVRVDARQVVERDVQPVPARERRVQMGVLEGGEHHPAGEVEDFLRIREAFPHRGSVPTAAIRSPTMATAPAQRRAASIVYASAPVITRSAVLAGSGIGGG